MFRDLLDKQVRTVQRRRGENEGEDEMQTSEWFRQVVEALNAALAHVACANLHNAQAARILNGRA